MKLVTGSIFSLAFFFPLHADCTRIENFPQALSLWRTFNKEFGEQILPRGFFVCVGRSYFFEIKDGAKIQSVLDRKRKRILLRTNSKLDLNHEMAHLYLDLRWRTLPYSISEPLVVVMVNPAKCSANSIGIEPPLHERWKGRHFLEICDKKNLLKQILNAPKQERDTLPLY